MEDTQMNKQHRPTKRGATEAAKNLAQEANDATRQSPAHGGVQKAQGLIVKIRALLKFIVDDVIVAALKKILNRLKTFMKKALQVFDLDTTEKIQEAKNKAVHIVKEAGKQAVTAALITCLTALATGAQEALSGLIESGKRNIVTSIHGEDGQPPPSSQTSLFDRDPWGDRPIRPPAPPSSGYSGSSYGQSQQPRFPGNPWDRV